MSDSGGFSVKFKTRASRGKRAALSEDELNDGHGMAITELSELSVGMKVEAMDKYGKLYVAKVMELGEEDKDVLVHFEKWSSRYDEFIPLNSGRLHLLSQSKMVEMDREKERMTRQLSPGDRIQAKWTDGRMYLGTVVKLNDADVDLLFDDDITYTAPFSHVRKRVSKKMHEDELTNVPLLLSPTAEGRRNRAKKRKRDEDGISSPPSSPLFTPAKVMHCCNFDSDSTEMESDQDEPATIQRKSRLQRRGWVGKEVKCLVSKIRGAIRSDGEELIAKTRGVIRSDGEELAAKTRVVIRSDGEELVAKTRGVIRSDGEELAAKTRVVIRSDGEELVAKTRGVIRSDGEESVAKTRVVIRSDGEELAAKTRGVIRSDGEEPVAKTRGVIRSDGEELAAKTRVVIRSDGEELVAKTRGVIRSDGEESVAKTRVVIRSDGEELAAKTRGVIRSDGEEPVAKTRGVIRSDGEELAAKTRVVIRSDGEESVAKTRVVIKSDGEEPVAKTRGVIRSDVEELVAKTRGAIRSDGEELAAKTRGVIRSDGEELVAKTRVVIRSDGEELAAKTRGVIRSDGEELVAKTRGVIRSDGEEPAAKTRVVIRSDGEEPVAKTRVVIRSDGEESVAKTRVVIRSDGEELVAKTRVVIRSDGEELAAKTRGVIRSDGEELVAKTRGVIRSDGEEPAAKTRVVIRSDGEEPVAKTRVVIRSDGEESVAKTRVVIRSDGEELAAKTRVVIRSDGEEPVAKTRGAIRSDVEELVAKTRGAIRSDGEELATKKPFIVGEIEMQNKEKVLQVTSEEEEPKKLKDVGGMRQCEILTPVKEEKEESDKMDEGVSSSVLTTELMMDTISAEKEVPEPTASVVSATLSKPGITKPSSAQPSNSDPCCLKPRFSSRLRKVRDQSDSTRKPSSVATRTRAHTSTTVEKKLPVKQMRSVAALAPKGLVIEWDHNEFKCKVSGCSKSFRKSTLLESHIKHYHTSEALKQTKHREKSSPSGGVKLKSHKPLPSSQPNIDKNTGEEDGSETSLSSTTQEREAPLSSEVPSEPILLSGKQPAVKEPPNIPSFVEPSTSKDMNISAEKDSDKALDSAKMRTSAKSSRQKGETPKKRMGKEAASVAKLSTTKALSTQSNKGGRNQEDVSATSTVTTTNTSSTPSFQSVRKQSVIVDSTSAHSVRKEPSVSTHWEPEPEPGPSEECSDDIVHCVCGSEVDEGFMIQCEECLCWQHGDCIGIRSDVLPKKYTCYVCTNPPGAKYRLKYKYKYSEEWYGEGTLPSMPSAPHFSRAQSKAVLLSHELTDSLYRVQKMMHSSNVKLQAASISQHPYLKQWGKECCHYSKDAIVSYSMDQLLPAAYQPNHEQEVTAQATIAKEVKLETGNGGIEGLLCPSEAVQECQVEDGEERKVFKRKLRTSTVLQKQALYISPKRSRKCQGSPSCNNAVPLRRDDEAFREASSGSSPLPVPSSAAVGEEGNDMKPLLPISQAFHPTITTITSLINTSPKLSPPPQAIDRDTVSARNVNLSTGASGTQHNSTELTESNVVEPGEDLMTVISQDEFGVSEVPVFAMDSHRLPHLPARFLPPLSVSTAPAARLPKIGCGGNSAVNNTPSFSPSIQSAFKPVPLTGTKPNTTITMNANAVDSTPGFNLPPTRTTISEALLAPSGLPSTTGMEPVTLEEFSEAFLQGDTTNWFRRMKLLDHIESVQDNMQDWLDLIGKKLTDVPDDPNMLENSDKMLSQLHHTLQRLEEYQRTSS